MSKCFMVDYAGQDSRSVAASLQGRDDGRTGRYNSIFAEMFSPKTEMGHNDLVYAVGFRMDQMETHQTSGQLPQGVGIVKNWQELARGARDGAMHVLVATLGLLVAIGLLSLVMQ